MSDLEVIVRIILCTIEIALLYICKPFIGFTSYLYSLYLVHLMTPKQRARAIDRLIRSAEGYPDLNEEVAYLKELQKRMV